MLEINLTSINFAPEAGSPSRAHEEPTMGDADCCENGHAHEHAHAHLPSSQHAARMEAGGFQLVSSRRRGKAPAARAATAKERAAASFLSRQWSDNGAGSEEADDAALAAVGRRVEAAMAEVRQSPFYAGLLRALRSQQPVASILCLGVGNFASSYSARCQMALALLLRDALLVDGAEACAADCCGGGDSGGGGTLHVYDPLLDAVELRYVRTARGCALRPANEAGRVAVGGRCLCLLLHCPRALYSNLLAANWGPARLPDVIVLGNSFAALADSIRPAERASTAGWCRVTRVAHLASETPCEALAGAAHAADFDHAFASSSLHSFDAASMPADGDELWERPFEPTPEAGDEGLLADFG